MRKVSGIWSILLSCFLSECNAADLAPWYPRNLELQPGLTWAFQHFDNLERPCGNIPYRSFDNFFNFSIGGAYDVYAIELEALLADTRKNSFGFDSGRITGRYLLANDVIGDPISAAAGATAIFSNSRFRKDPGTFHHGGVELEAHLAIGKEWSCKQFWQQRAWGAGAIGIADVGSPWLRFKAAYEFNSYDIHAFHLYAEGLIGLGGNNLPRRIKHFRGYGPIKHPSIDLGLSYTMLFASCSDAYVTIGFAQRVYAHNFPNHASVLFAGLLVPFGL